MLVRCRTLLVGVVACGVVVLLSRLAGMVPQKCRT